MPQDESRDAYRSLPMLLDFLTGVLLVLWLLRLAPVEPIMVSLVTTVSVSAVLRIKYHREDKDTEREG